jgi:uncharacterized protein (DUF58 family)
MFCLFPLIRPRRRRALNVVQQRDFERNRRARTRGSIVRMESTTAPETCAELPASERTQLPTALQPGVDAAPLDAAAVAPRRRSYLQSIVDLLNYDFCPSTNRLVYWLKRPHGFLAVAGLVALICALFLNAVAWVAVGAVTVVLVLGLVWPWIAMKGLSASLLWDSKRGREGEPVGVRLKVRNRWPWPVWGLAVQGGFRQDTVSAALTRVPALCEVEFTWSFTPDERGVYPTQSPLLETGFPFGLWKASRTIAVKQELLVWPMTAQLDGLPDLTDGHQSEERLSDRRAGDLGDILGTRGFRQGDSLRRVHWAQSARHQRLIVTERQSGAESRVCVRIDACSDSHSGHGVDSTLNCTLRIAASICQTLHAEHTHVDCVIGGDAICLNKAGGLSRLMDRLARIPESGLPHTPAPGRASTYQGCEFVCTTDRRLQNRETRPTAGRNRREVIIAAGEERIGSDGQVRSSSRHAPWLFIPSTLAASAEFPRYWKRACQFA